MLWAYWQLEPTRPSWAAALVISLAGVLLLAPVVYYSWRSLAHFPRWQRAASLVVRALLVLLLVWALAVALWSGPLRSTTRQLSVVFAVDESLSISDAASEEARAFLQAARKHADGNQVAFLPFAAEPGPVADSPPGQSPDNRRETNLAAAIAAAGAATAPGYVPRVVLLSDGNQTAGDALATARAARMPVWTVPLPGCPKNEVYVSAVETKAEVREGEPFDVQVTVESTHEGDGTVRLLEGTKPVATRRGHVVEGENRFSFRHAITGKSQARLTVQLEGFEDTVGENNRASALVLVSGRPRALLIEGGPETGRHLAAALRQQYVDVEVRPPEAVPDRLDGLQGYQLLILSDVPATSLPAERMQLIQRYVRDFGGGLIVVGGYRSFTPGGYRDTLLEEILPVSSDLKKDRPKPSLAMVLLIDRSASMEGESIELAKQATRQAVETLGPRDQVGVIAFADTSNWVSEIHPCSDKASVLRRIDTIAAGGGTNLHPAMEKAYLALHEAFADLKHMIVLSDGLSHPGDFEGLVRDIAASGITVSTVAVGKEAAEGLLQDIARRGKGRYYYCDSAAAVPRIFVLEAASAGKVGITEEPFRPQVVGAAEVLTGIDLRQAPVLWGYAETRPKPEAHLVLAAKDGDPLLASWRYGSGISLAFTSDVQDRWAADWLGWPDFGRFWAQLARYAMRKDGPTGFVLQVEQEHGWAWAVLDAVDGDGEYINAAEGMLDILDPKGQTHKTRLVQIAPGRYAANFPTPMPGAYRLEATLSHGGRRLYVGRRGLVVEYADELRLKPTNEELLRSIAETTGGRYNPEPGAVFAPPERTALQTTFLWPYLLTAAALLFLIDVALKRIDLTRKKPPLETTPCAEPSTSSPETRRTVSKRPQSLC